MNTAALDEKLTAAILARLSTGAASICPSDAARAVAPQDWRTLMPEVRRVAAALAVAGRVEITQGGIALDPTQPWRGPIRLRLPLR